MLINGEDENLADIRDQDTQRLQLRGMIEERLAEPSAEPERRSTRRSCDTQSEMLQLLDGGKPGTPERRGDLSDVSRSEGEMGREVDDEGVGDGVEELRGGDCEGGVVVGGCEVGEVEVGARGRVVVHEAGDGDDHVVDRG